ncbi:MAG: helix-turn-helix transcriptional regulator [Clostridia bacterium]|nr:helix-turn-helix transcriptional regulator [Clostridia bacterium]MBQ8147152.1 helix-turn-helix transcriptional regulator [Clostridia bacterium]
MEKNFLITKIEMVVLFRKQKSTECYPSTLLTNELVFDFSGEYTVYFGDTVLRVLPNTIRFFPRGTVSKYEIERTKLGECIDVFFQTDRPISNAALAIDAKDKEYIGALFKKLFSIWTNKDNGYYFECMSLLYKIFANIQKNNYLPTKQYLKIEPAIVEIERSFLDRKLTGSYLASICNISEPCLYRLFKKKFGIPIKKYIIQKKMNYACELLRLNRHSINHVAEKCGFSDVYFFSKQFKSQIGISPTEYIKKCNT